jgi:hypothetical protein
MIFDEFEMEKSVKLAADVLDEMYPQWYEAIDLDGSFYMYDGDHCILGQIARSMNNEYTYPAEEKHYSTLWNEVSDYVKDDSEILVAFDLEHTEDAAASTYQIDGWNVLKQVWARTVRARR